MGLSPSPRTITSADWSERYHQHETPWDSGNPSPELIRSIADAAIAPCRTIELGCGTGTNSICLAGRGFDVTAVGFVESALEEAGSKASAGNANEQNQEQGPTRVHEHEIRAELGALFDFQWIREFRFASKTADQGPLAWSCLLRRKTIIR